LLLHPLILFNSTHFTQPTHQYNITTIPSIIIFIIIMRTPNGKKEKIFRQNLNSEETVTAAVNRFLPLIPDGVIILALFSKGTPHPLPLLLPAAVLFFLSHHQSPLLLLVYYSHLHSCPKLGLKIWDFF
jgi:hypothetical protein